MQIGILGPLEVASPDGAPVPVSGTRLRRLLTRLALDAGRPVGSTELIDAVWPDDPPAESANALQSLASRLRRTLGDPNVVRQVGSGYLLAVSPDDVDVHRFANLTRDARGLRARGDHAGAHAAFSTALSLWRGQPLADADAADYAIGPAARLDEQRIDALSARIDADLALGRAASVVGELEGLAQSYPMREQLTAQLMRALAASGRTAEALAAYDRLRVTLADALGTDPAPEMQALHVALLRGEGPVAEQHEPHARTNLRVSLTSFIGREPDRERLVDLLRHGRLVTVVGPGGAGKTRLAEEVARDLVAGVRDGVWFVPLAPVSSEADVAEAFLGALELREAHVVETRRRGPRDASSRLLEALEGRDTVLVVDNCEHLVDAVAGLVDKLLRTAPGVRIIGTSLEPLNIDGEAVATLAPLGVPPENATSAEAAGHAAVQLFMDRAGSVRGDLTLDDSTVADVVEVVRRLDGMPLAIELAAARARVLPVREIAHRLSDRFRLLTGGSRTALPRHQTLRAVVDWSWDLLSGEERLLASRLAVFPSGATVESAAAVCSDERVDAITVVDLLDTLADKSFLVAGPEVNPSPGSGDGGVRYRMLETIREYCLERLAETGQAETVRRRHADWFAGLVARVEPQLRTREQLYALRCLEAESDNILAAIRYLIDTRDGAAAIRVAVNLMWYSALVGSPGDMTTWLQAALEQPSDTEINPVQRVLAEAGLALSAFVDESDAVKVIDAQEWRAAVTDLSDRLRAVADVLSPPGVMMQAVLGLLSGDSKRADAAVAAGLASPDPWCRAAVRMVRANAAENAGDLRTLRSDVEIALQEFGEIGDQWGLASVLTSLGYIRTLDGDLDGALDAYTEAVGALGAIGARQDELLIGVRIAELHLRTGRYDRARSAIAELGRADLQRIGQVLATTMAARLAVLEEDTVEVSRLRSRLEALTATMGVPTPFAGHGKAIALTALASLQLEQGDQVAAASTLLAAYAVAVGTADMPILAGTGTVVAALAATHDRPELAADVLGAAARLQGAEDPTDPFVRHLTAHLRAVLGDRFAAAYDRGRQLSSEDAIVRLDPAGVAGSSDVA